MLLLLNITTILLLLVIAFQDFKDRKISGVFVVLTFILLFLIATKSSGLFPGLKLTAINFFFILMQIALLFVFYFIINKRPVNIINTHLGIGDILFIIAISPSASP